MTVLLILTTFVIFLTIDYFYGRKPVVQAAPGARERAALAPLPPNIVAGFALPDHLRYHPGHAWALSESPKRMRLGLDDFAARLIGNMDRLSLPQRGRWVRQGQTLLTAYRDGSKAEIVSPMEGMVTDVNEAVVRDPSLALRDPYGEGWLVTVECPDAKTNFRNLLSGALARRWMEEAAARLFGRMPALAGAVAQDGGIAVSDLTSHLPEHDWMDLTREFFLS
jgi:glycine cleavage system H lipoate-binding protein